MADGFTDLHIRTDGVGDYDLNRFRIVFRSRGADARTLAESLRTGFAGYLAGPAATAQPSGPDMMKFHGNAPLPFQTYLRTPHIDWVRTAMREGGRAFTFTTLHRDYEEPGETAAKVAAAAAGPGAQALALAAVRANKYHVLAGRRSWRVETAASARARGDSTKLPDDVIIAETAAVERFSLRELLPIKWAFRRTVVEIWCTLMSNFASRSPVDVLDGSEWPLEAGWMHHPDGRNDVHHYVRQSSDEGGMTGGYDFQEVVRLFPCIWEYSPGCG